MQVVPGSIPAATRVALRVQSVTPSKSVPVSLLGLGEKSVAFGAPVTMGVNTATSGGVDLPTGGGGVWTQIVAATAQDFKALVVSAQHRADATINGVSGTGVRIDIGAGTPETIIGWIWYTDTNTEAMIYLSPATFGIDIPAGTRLSARIATGTDIGNIILVGCPAA
jgi:hypothetical protein